MAKSSVISFVLIVFLFVVGKIERVSSQYVSDEGMRKIERFKEYLKFCVVFLRSDGRSNKMWSHGQQSQISASRYCLSVQWHQRIDSLWSHRQ